jgi:hypothetical protein
MRGSCGELATCFVVAKNTPQVSTLFFGLAGCRQLSEKIDELANFFL